MSVPKYVTSSNAEMLGLIMQAYFDNLRSAEVEPFLQDILAKYNLETFESDEWYPVQIALDLYHSIVEKGSSMTDLVAIGIRMGENAHYAEDINSIPKALGILNESYKNGMRNYPPEEGYAIEHVSERHVRIHEHTPYPHDLMYGYIYGVARRFCPPDGQITVERTYLNEDEPDADGAFYDVMW